MSKAEKEKKPAGFDPSRSRQDVGKLEAFLIAPITGDLR